MKVTSGNVAYPLIILYRGKASIGCYTGCQATKFVNNFSPAAALKPSSKPVTRLRRIGHVFIGCPSKKGLSAKHPALGSGRVDE